MGTIFSMESMNERCDSNDKKGVVLKNITRVTARITLTPDLSDNLHYCMYTDMGREMWRCAISAISARL